MGIPSWIFRYYIDPIIYDTSYNPVDTVTWALMLGIMVLALARASKKFDIKFDEGLVAATMPYILAGSSLRVMEDTRIVIPPLSYLLITPLIYFLVFFVTSSSLVLTRWIWKESYLKAYAGVGSPSLPWRTWPSSSDQLLRIHGFWLPWRPWALPWLA